MLKVIFMKNGDPIMEYSSGTTTLKEIEDTKEQLECSEQAEIKIKFIIEDD